MDKFEYKVRAEEIKSLIAQGEYVEAVKIADTIDWRRVKSIMMLCTISDLYKINRRFEESKELLLMAYERHPGGRTIVYSLCELSIKMEEYVQAIEYYKEFVQIAPRDSGRYILQYKLYEAQDVSLEERIAVLEELKKRDYREKWAYELAYLYHRIGLSTKCVEECDELALWFGEGKYVIKAMELKMLHQPLTPEQEKRYKMQMQGISIYERYEEEEEEEKPEEDVLTAATTRIGADELDDIHVKTLDMGQYNTINLQKELAASMKELLDDGTEVDESLEDNSIDPITKSAAAPLFENTEEITAAKKAAARYAEEREAEQGELVEEEVFFGETGEIGEMLEAGEIPEGYQAYETGFEEFTEEDYPDIEEEEIVDTEEAEDLEESDYLEDPERFPDIEELEEAVDEEDLEEFDDLEEPENPEEIDDLEEPGDLEEITDLGEPEKLEEAADLEEPEDLEEIADLEEPEDIEEIADIEEPEDLKTAADVKEAPDKVKETAKKAAKEETENTSAAVMQQMRKEAEETSAQSEINSATYQILPEVPAPLAGMLSQEYDGQISLVVPEGEKVEKQITGQMSIQDILAEWERMKKDNEEKRKEDVRRRVKEQTGNMFAEFDESTKSGILAQLDELDAAVKEKEAQKEQVTFNEDEAEYGEELAEIPEPEEEEGLSEEIEDQSLEAIPEEEAEDISDEAKEGEEDSEEASAEAKAVREEGEKTEKGLKEDNKETIAAETSKEKKTAAAREEDLEDIVDERMSLRQLTDEEKELFGAYIHTRKAKEQFIKSIDSISMAAYTGNIIVTGDDGNDTIALAKNLVREVQASDNNFSGKVAKISGASLNKKDVEATISRMENGALIIDGAAKMSAETVSKLYKYLDHENKGIIVVITGTKREINKFLKQNDTLKDCFTARFDIEALDDDALTAYGKKYAEFMEYSIDELGMLALHTRISDMQTSTHIVNVAEVKEIVNEAINHANRKNLTHFFDILLAKRYDDEDMIILRERDFN